MVGNVSGVIEGSFLQAENVVCLEAATGGPTAVPSVLATILTPGFDLLLHGYFPMCEARGRIRDASGKFPSRPVLLLIGLGWAWGGPFISWSLEQLKRPLLKARQAKPE